MKKKNYLLIIVFAVFLLIVVFAVIPRFPGEDYEVVSILIADDIRNIVYAEKTSVGREEVAFVLPTSSILQEERYSRGYLPGNQMILMEAEGEVIKRHDGDGRTRTIGIDWDYVYAHVYDLLSKERIETIDVLRLSEEHLSEEREFNLWLCGGMVPTIFRGRDGDLYIVFTLSAEWKEYSLQINLQTREVDIMGKAQAMQVWNQERTRNEIIRDRDLDIFSDWAITDSDDRSERNRFLRQNGIANIGSDSGSAGLWVSMRRYDGVVSILLPATNLPQESYELYSRFPGLCEFIGRENLNVNVFIGDYPSPEEILTMFMEDGREISFEGLVMRPNLNRYGLVSEIHSFEDFNRRYRMR
ncbi:MAG: hypothetical protein FWE25_11365 [Lachnospiraceae bacterium]|nr:hypothetical protein [Lachnospiraceae bacterium]